MLLALLYINFCINSKMEPTKSARINQDCLGEKQMMQPPYAIPSYSSHTYTGYPETTTLSCRLGIQLKIKNYVPQAEV